MHHQNNETFNKNLPCFFAAPFWGWISSSTSQCVFFFSGSDALDAFLKPKATLAPLVSGPRGDALDSLLAPKTTLLPRKLEALDPVVGHKEMPKMEKEKELKGGGRQVLDCWSWSVCSFFFFGVGWLKSNV